MSFKPQVETREQRSQASPLADDLLQMIQGQIDSGAFGSGIGSLQQGAGSAIQRFMDSGFMSTPGTNFGEMVSALEQVQNRRVGEQAADLREQAGVLGTRYGSTLGTAEGRFRGQAQDDFNVTLQNLAMALDEARRGDAGLQLGAIGQMFGMGQAATNPAFQLASQGILPEHLLVSQGSGQTFLDLLTAGGALAGGLGPILQSFMGGRGGGGGTQLLGRTTPQPAFG